MVATLEDGRQAIQRHAWNDAVRALTEVEGHEGLSPDDLMLLGDAYWWSAEPDDAVSVFERAFQGYVDEGRSAEAASVGALLAYFAMRRMAMSVAGGWTARVASLLEDQPESPGHAWLQLLHLVKAFFAERDLQATLGLADGAIEIAKRQHVPGVHSLALSFKGMAKVYMGEWKEGLGLVDEAAALAMSAESDLRASSDVYCNTIAACSSLADYRRAGEWTEMAERWMRTNSVGGFTGVCKVHRAQLKRLKGSWSEAEREARVACDELERFHLLNGLGYAHYEIGEVRRRMGDLEAAEDSFMRAYEYGHDAQPGLSLLMIDRGQVEEAAKSIARALAATKAAGSQSTDLLSRGHLLPAQVEIAIAGGDLETAREAIEELEEISELYATATWEALAQTCRGSYELSVGNADDAVVSLGKAWREWQQIDLPYEAARAREILGRARLAAGDENGGRLELRAARSTYEQLGAGTDLARIGELTGDAPKTTDSGERLTKAFMFTDIVTSTDLIGIIGDTAWEKLLHWHDRELRETFKRHSGEEVRHTGDGFFVAFDSPRSAIDCAVSIQRKLAGHRLEHGFSPTVRIGIHVAEATRHRGDYSGGGVHTAARIGDLGAGDEIVVSSDALVGAGAIPYPTKSPHTVDLKGIAEPVEVHKIDWRT